MDHVCSSEKNLFSERVFQYLDIAKGYLQSLLPASDMFQDVLLDMF